MMVGQILLRILLMLAAFTAASTAHAFEPQRFLATAEASADQRETDIPSHEGQNERGIHHHGGCQSLGSRASASHWCTTDLYRVASPERSLLSAAMTQRSVAPDLRPPSPGGRI